MTRRILSTAATVLGLAAFPRLAFAHTQGTGSFSLVHGLAHPVGGLDHLMAMGLVGLLAWQMGGAYRWQLPVLFVSAMALGGALGIAGVGIPMFELGIVLSVVLLGAMLAFGARLPAVASAVLVGTSAIFHGYAHGAEMPSAADGVSYAVGFLLATALLHASGLAIGFLTKAAGPMPARLIGGLSALVGLGLVFGIA